MVVAHVLFVVGTIVLFILVFGWVLELWKVAHHGLERAAEELAKLLKSVVKLQVKI